MRKVDVVRPPISYTVTHKKRSDSIGQVAWFLVEEDAKTFLDNMALGEQYEIAEVR